MEMNHNMEMEPLLNYTDWAAYYDRIIIERKAGTCKAGTCKAGTCKAGTDKKDDEVEECAICLDLLEKKLIAHLPCKHAFHLTCLKQAVQAKNYSCPLCRYNLVQSLRQIGELPLPVPVPEISYFWNNLFRNMPIFDLTDLNIADLILTDPTDDELFDIETVYGMGTGSDRDTGIGTETGTGIGTSIANRIARMRAYIIYYST
jgi:hypothetical protein